jgi:hypothetical protein
LYSIIVVPPPTTEDERDLSQIRLAPGERLTFGRSAPDNDLRITHDGVSRRAGEITAQGAFWILSNLSREQTYAVENPEGAGEHVKVAPGRLVLLQEGGGRRARTGRSLSPARRPAEHSRRLPWRRRPVSSAWWRI